MSKPQESKYRVFRIIDRKTGQAEGVYSRACHHEYDFYSPSEARHANCHDIYNDRERYAIAEYEVTYKLINPDVYSEQKSADPVTFKRGQCIICGTKISDTTYMCIDCVDPNGQYHDKT